ncbi:hypothetical protein [Psychrilyobacter atlanticus]|uniref:hypothetical protein n=1 Tax=Psychrilyobacter atlanticus TaxID=271091 RepID=UPI000407DA74|nr:hypothetical protein [Psychrilyobacter atlanticus]
MSFKQRKSTTLTVRRGDSAGKVVVLADSQMYQRGNGIYIDLPTGSDVETVISGIVGELDGVINKYNSPAGTYIDEDMVIPQDTHGDSAVKVFTVSFSDSKDKCNIVIPNVKATGNVATIAALLKTQKFKDAADTALTIAKVDVKQSF